MRQPTLSFCIPTHNRVELLKEALESGLNQTRLPDEIVVSDNLGTDETRLLVESFAGRVSFPVRYVPCAGGTMSHNINNCFQAASCDLVLLLHDDDLLTPRAVELLRTPFMENEKIVASYGKQFVVVDDGTEQPDSTEDLNRSYGRTPERAGLQPNALLAGATQQFPNDGYVVRRDVARKVLHRLDCGLGSEVDFGIRMGTHGDFYFVDEFTAKYRLSAQSLGRGVAGKKADYACHVMEIQLQLLKDHPELSAEITSHIRRLTPVAIGMALNTGKLNKATEWYFGPYHRERIVSLGGIRRGLWLGWEWLKRGREPGT